MKKLILLIISLIIFSCNTEESATDIYAHFKKKSTLKAKKMVTQETLGLPIKIIIKDTLLILDDFKYDYLLYFYNISNGKLLTKTARVGKGPNEFIPPVYISFNKKGQLLLYEGSKFGFKKYFIKRDLSFKPILSLQLNGRSQRVYEIIENYYLSTGFFDNYRFAIYDSTAKEIVRFGSFPEIDIFNKTGKKLDLKNDTKAMLFQSNIDFMKDGLSFVVANSQLGLLELYSKDNDIYLKKKEFRLTDKVILKDYSSGKSIRANIDDEYPKGFVDIHIKNEQIYALYSGATKTNPYKSSYIMVFDTNLIPIQIYSLDKAIKAFDIDVENSKIYAISEEQGEPKIVYFNF
jgi:hypothetical protein